MISIARTIISCLLLHTYTVKLRIKVEGAINVPLLKVSRVTIGPRIDIAGVKNHGG